MTVVQDTYSAEALSERVFGASVEAMYLAAHPHGPRAGALRRPPRPWGADVRRSGCADRYRRALCARVARASGGRRDPDGRRRRSADAGERRYSLPAGHAEALLDHETPYSVGPFAQFIVGEIQPIDATIDAFRTGEGVSYDTYPVCRVAQAEVNRPMFVHELGSTWIPALPERRPRVPRPRRPRRRRGLRVGLVVDRAGARLPEGRTSTATTPTARRSSWPRPTCAAAASSDRCASSPRTARPPAPRRATTSSRSSRRCTTCRTRSRCWRTRASCSPPAAS